MKKNTSKVFIIILIIVVLLAIAGGVFAYLYLFTDIFKSGQELFAKYLTQNLDEIKNTVSINTLGEIKEKLKQNPNEQDTKVAYTEAGNTQESMALEINSQKDPAEGKSYSSIKLSAEDLDQSLQLEYMKEDDIYSLRFTNIVKQFISVENYNLKQLAEKLGLDEETINTIPNVVDFEQFSLETLELTDEEKSAEINKYSQLLFNNISEDKYTKNKNSVITVNGKTITTNAFILTLNAQDIKDLSIKLLETLEQDEILLAKLDIIDDMVYEYINQSVKNIFINTIQNSIDELNEQYEEKEENITITVYEQNKKTVRVKVEQGLKNIVVDTLEIDGKKQINVNYTDIDEYNTQLTKQITFVKESDNKLKIQNYDIIDGEEKQGTQIDIEIIDSGNNVKINVTIDDENSQITLVKDINFVEEITYDMVLNSSNNIVLNDLSQEQIAYVLSATGERLKTEYMEPLQKLLEKYISLYNMLQNQESNYTTQELPNIDELEKNQFNEKFKVYEGENISTLQVKAILNTVFSSNKQEAELESDTNAAHYVIVSGDVELKSDATYIGEIEGTDYYTVECKTNQDGWINELVIKVKR